MADTVTTAMNTALAKVGSKAATYLSACVHCGVCATACHYAQGSGEAKHIPIWKAELLKREYKRRYTWLGKLRSAIGLLPKTTPEMLEEWSELVFDTCSMCGRCSVVCPMGIDIPVLIRAMREGLTTAGVVPEGLKEATDRAMETGSPLGATPEVFAERIEWMGDEWEQQIPVDKEGAEYLVLFSSIEIMKYPNSIGATAKVLNAAGLNWTVHSKNFEGTNFGYLQGNSGKAATMLNRVVDAAEQLKVKKVISPECGHAYGALRWEAQNLLARDLPFEVVQIAELIDGLMQAGKIKVHPEATAGKATYHDPCQIGRRGGLFDEPRRVLHAIVPDGSFGEMSENKMDNWCCGGGGGVISIPRADELRFKSFGMKKGQIEEVGAQRVISTCSNCRLAFDSAFEHYGMKTEFVSLVELVAENLEENPS